MSIQNIQNMFTGSLFMGTPCADKPFECRVTPQYSKLHLEVICIENHLFLSMQQMILNTTLL